MKKTAKPKSFDAQIRFIRRHGASYQRYGLRCAVQALYNVIRRQRGLNAEGGAK